MIEWHTSNVPVWYRWVDSVLSWGTETFAGVYLDDIYGTIILYSKTCIPSLLWTTSSAHLRDVFQQLHSRKFFSAHLTVKMKTCVFGAEDCVYLGYRIGQGGVRPEESRIQAILDITQPKTKKTLGFFSGWQDTIKRFIRDYAIITEPLTELIKKNSPEDVQWDVRTELAFQKLKQMLVSTPLMQNPDFILELLSCKRMLQGRGWSSFESRRGRGSTSGLLQQEAFAQGKGILHYRKRMPSNCPGCQALPGLSHRETFRYPDRPSRFTVASTV